MNYKEHKKMYKVGKKWAVATLVSASVLMGGALTAHADQAVSDSTNTNESTLVSETPSNTKNSAADSQSSTNATSQSAQTNDAASQSSQVTNDSSVSHHSFNLEVKNDPATPSQDSSVELKTSGNENSPAAQANLKKLNKAAADAVKNAGVDLGSLTDDQINELNKINFSKSAEKGAKLTFKDLQGIGNALINQDPRYAIPYFNAREIKNMPASHVVDAQTGKMADLDVWDSWPVQDPVTGYVSNYKGYQLVIAMMGIPNTSYGDNHIYLLYNKYGDNDFSHWRNAGSIFGTNENNVYQEWSGSAIVNKDGSIQLFYTLNDTSDYKLNDQKLATATLNLNVDDNGVTIKNVTNNHVLFEGDGYHYQNYKQFASGPNRAIDDYCLRDPHVVQLENGDRYLVFESNTGTEDYQDDAQVYNWANYGGDDAFNLKSFLKLVNNKKDRALAGVANGALGILKLNDNQANPQVDAVYSPLLSTLMASDEVERPNVVKLGDKYYLFSATRISRGSDTELTSKADHTVGDNVAMIGYVADSLTGPYKPLNDSGVVLTASVPANWRTATYSYYAVPVKGHANQVLVTSYMSNKDFASGKGNYATWAPSFLVQVNPDGTTAVLARTTNQGDWIWDDSSRNDNMLGVLDKNATNSSSLPGEWGKPLDPNLIIGSGLLPHVPAQPQRTAVGTGADYDLPEGHIPTTVTPGQPSTPENPSVPNQPGTPGQSIVPDHNTPEQSGKNDGHIITTTHQNSESNTPKATENAKLPQTGNESGVLGILVGSFLAMFGLAVAKKRD